jgi:serine/threonine protein kinase
MRDVMQDALDRLLDRQKRAWLDGARPSVDDLLRDSSLPRNPETMLDLLYNEILVREELDETPSLDEYLSRYPHLGDDLKIHFEVHRAVQENLVLDTRRISICESAVDQDFWVPDCDTPADYEIVGELGRGGMGIVYKARHRRLKRFIALKTFHPGRLPSARELTRFGAEARAIARLQHPNIVQIFEVGQERGKPFLALEFAEKGTLAQKIREMPLTPRDAAELLASLANAVQHAHEQNIVHRDLKPANVLFTRDGTAKITDFGLAKLLEPDGPEEAARRAQGDATVSGEPLGTPRYMAPEQAAGRLDRIGPATDIYALGNILYECLTGQVPFLSSSVVETMDRIRSEDPAPPRRSQKAIPRDLETICLKCLHKEPERRYGSARALADDLERFLRGEPILGRRISPWEHASRWSRRNPAFATLIAAGFAFFVAGSIAMGVRHHRERQRLADLRTEVGALVVQGQQALARQEPREAKEAFLSALTKIKDEPALADHELGVRGWYDQAVRDSERYRWRQRRPPPTFDERFEEALALATVLEPQDAESAEAIGQAVRLALTTADDSVRRSDRRILESLDAASHVPLDPKSPDIVDLFLSAFDRHRKHDDAGAIRDLDRLLANEPEHFPGRFLQAQCFLCAKRAAEAKVALTACIGQRPDMAWPYLLRSAAHLQLADAGSAAQDLQCATDFDPKGAARKRLDVALRDLRAFAGGLPEAEQTAYRNVTVRTAAGPKRLGELHDFRVPIEKGAN